MIDEKEVMQIEAGPSSERPPVAPPPASEAGGDVRANDDKPNMTTTHDVPMPEPSCYHEGIPTTPLYEHKKLVAYADGRVRAALAPILRQIGHEQYAQAVEKFGSAGDPYSEAIAHVAKLQAECDGKQKQIHRRANAMNAVYAELQRVAPWSESNDMDWVDEMLCGISLLAQERDALAEKVKELQDDARRYRFLRDLQCCSMTVSKNDGHAPNYMNLPEWIECSPDLYDDVPPEELERMKAAGVDWAIQVYPNTPVGFNVWHAATLDAAIDAAGGGDA